MIQQLQELSADSRKLHEDFEDRAQQFESDFKGQVAAFSDFEEHERTISELENRIHAGVTRVETLSGRLEKARKTVEIWGERENQWQQKTTGRRGTTHFTQTEADIVSLCSEIENRMELFRCLVNTCDNPFDLEAGLSVLHRRSLHHRRPKAIVEFSSVNGQRDIRRTEDVY